jgi:hypothetical protein
VQLEIKMQFHLVLKGQDGQILRIHLIFIIMVVMIQMKLPLAVLEKDKEADGFAFESVEG